MAFNHEFPYVDPNRYNSDWLLHQVKDLVKKFEEFVIENQITYHDPIDWSITTQYKKYTIVKHEGKTYLSKKPVPIGINVDNTEYWLKISDEDTSLEYIRHAIEDNDEKDNMTSEHDYAKDDILWNKDKLWLVLRPIDTGDAFVTEGANPNLRLVVLVDLIRGIESALNAFKEEVNTEFDAIDSHFDTVDTHLTTLDGEIDSLEQKIIERPFVDPRDYGAKLDGVTNDTMAIREALTHGSLLFPRGSHVLLRDVDVPDFTTIDFNDSFVYLNGVAVGDYCIGLHHDTSYRRMVTIKNAHFILPNDNRLYRGIHANGTIKCTIENCEVANIYTKQIGFDIYDSFNLTLRNVYVGTGNSEGYVADTAGIKVTATATPDIAGTNNITNCIIENALIQNVNVGITLNNSGLIDTLTIRNVGFSYCTTAINTTLGGGIGETAYRNNIIDTIRCEFCNYGIMLHGEWSVINPYFTRIGSGLIALGVYDKVTVLGTVSAYNPTDNAYLFGIYANGVLNATACNFGVISHFTNVIVSGGIYNPPYLLNGGDVISSSKLGKYLWGTTPASGNSFTVNYPSGFNKDNAHVLSKKIRRNTGTTSTASWDTDDSHINVVFTSSNILVYIEDTAIYHGASWEICLH